MKKPPYNVGFGMFLYLKNSDLYGIYPHADLLLRDIMSHGLRDFDVYHVSEGLDQAMVSEIEAMHHLVSEKYRNTYFKFIKEFIKHFEKKQSVEESILKLLKSVNANNILQVKKLAGQREYAIPRVAVKTLQGFSDTEPIQIEIESSSEVMYLDTDQMNPVELACVRGFHDILRYFTREMNLTSKSEFNAEHEFLKIEEMPFIFVPIAQKQTEILEILLNLPNLWSYEDLKQISILLKQVKWREGFKIFFKSLSVHHQYKMLSFPERFRFIRDCLMLPYQLETIPFEPEDDSDYPYTYENNLSDEEARSFYLSIKDALCEMPYACAMVLQHFAFRTRETYTQATGYQSEEDFLSQETIEERIISMQLCNNIVTDDILHQYIQFCGGEMLLQKLYEQKEWTGDINEQLYNEVQFETLKSKYAQEIKEFTEKIRSHPSIRQIGVKDPDWAPSEDGQLEKRMTFVEKAEM